MGDGGSDSVDPAIDRVEQAVVIRSKILERVLVVGTRANERSAR